MTTAQEAPAHAWFWDNYRDTTISQYIVEREKSFLDRTFGVAAPGGRILEVACGSGRLTVPLHGEGHRIVGLDIDPAALAAFRTWSDAVPLVLGDAHHLPFADGVFSGLIAIEVFPSLHHGQFPLECRRILGTAGMLVFESLNRHSYKGMLTMLARRVAGIGAFRRIMQRSRRLRALQIRFVRSEDDYPSRGESLAETLEAAKALGFEVEAVSGFNWLPFRRVSNSRLVKPAAWLESALRLDRHPGSSPWVLLAARKKTQPQSVS